MKFTFNDWELTGREIALVFSVLLFMIGCGVGIGGCIERSDNRSDYRYNKALGIEKNPSKMHQAMITDAGDAFISADFSVVDPVSENHLEGKWLEIHTLYQEEEEVAHHWTDEDGHVHTSYHWEWHTKKEWKRKASRILCNEIEFPINTFDYRCVPTQEFIYKTGSRGFFLNDRARFIFYCKGTKFSGAFFTTLNNKTMEGENIIHLNTTHEELRKSYTQHFGKMIAWSMLILTIVPLCGWFVVKNNSF